MTLKLHDAPPWYRKRHYLHFDRPVGLGHAARIVESPHVVARHAFYPMIKYDIVTDRVRKAPDGTLKHHPKARPIAYASHVDAHIYSYYAKQLERPYEAFLTATDLSQCVLAFRALGKSNIEFAAAAFGEIMGRDQCVAVALDVSKFFDNLNHKMLKHGWCQLLGVSSLPADHYNVYKSLTHFSTVDRDALYKTFGISRTNPNFGRNRVCTPSEFRQRVRDANLITVHSEPFGIPQGTPASAILSNIYMMDFDTAMKAYVDSVNGTYFRYCDDILLVVPTAETSHCISVSEERIGQLKLKLNDEKTVSRVFKRTAGVLRSDKPLQYLGFTFDGERVLIRSAALARYSSRVKRGVRLAQATRARWDEIRSKHGASKKDTYRRALYKKYSYLGRRNFVSYGHRAAKLMNSPHIRKQLKPLWKRLLRQIDKGDQ